MAVTYVSEAPQFEQNCAPGIAIFTPQLGQKFAAPAIAGRGPGAAAAGVGPGVAAIIWL
jgi:hypothetical protein